MLDNCYSETKHRKKCYRCFRPEPLCLCPYITPQSTKTKFVFIMHPKEFKKERVGTGRMTSLQLQNSIVLMGVNFTKSDTVNSLIEKSDCYILYPTPGSINISCPSNQFFKSCRNEPQAQRTIFIIDSTWSQAKKILKQSKNLSSLKAISFDPDTVSNFVFKQQPFPECLSTIESTHKVLNLMYKEKLENIKLDKFMAPFEKLLEQQIYFQNNPPEGSYRTQKLDPLDNKVQYKKGSINKVFFEE